MYDKELGSSPKGDERRNEQPEQSFHQKEKKTPEAEPFDPPGHGHSSYLPIRIASILTKPGLFGFLCLARGGIEIFLPAMIVFRKRLRLSGCETAQQGTVRYLPPKET